MLIFPAIDILDGKCVRLTEGVFGSEKTYSDDPVAVARQFEEEGTEWIHVVDLDAARSGSLNNNDIVAKICRSVKVKIQCGGGVRSIQTAKRLIDLGVTRVVVGSALTESDDRAANLFEMLGESVAAGIDTKDGEVTVKGWTETAALNGLDFAKRMVALGCTCVVTTEVTRDGTLQGPDLEGAKRFADALKVELIVGGGISSIEDISALKSAGVSGVIVGKALYEMRFTLPEAMQEGS
ncbi:MAG TPA: 1-(5-phosphoribosyl)-5-[(5-phosphoribosylamino)methylideneamino]imidazole-4-carboxamide isomerase [Fimbriimonadaceae bacterium]|nr:1-(5-phosphoribosyl)-5-[(5-phosphoribosylamino)methylideneamino]imidazole-4-carboxamide isomerase [Fimbriimonadaceae bacterium]